MAVKIDRETLAITALVGAMMIYFLTKKEETPQETQDEENKTEVDELRSHLEQLEARYDALDNELERSLEHDLPQWVTKELNEIAQVTNQVGQNASGLDMGDEWWERHSSLEASCQEHLHAHGEEMEARERYKIQRDRQGTTAPQVTLVSNHFHAQQNVDRRTVHAVQNVDRRNFQATHKHIHMSVGALPTHDDDFVSGGPSGSAAVRDQQAHNTRTSTNRIENSRPAIVGKHPVIVAGWRDVQVLDPERLPQLAITAPADPFISPQNSFQSAPKEGRDNVDNPPAEVQNQVALLQPVGRKTEQNFNSQVMDDEVPTQTHLTAGQAQLREFQVTMAQMDGLIDALRDTAKTGGEGPYKLQLRKIKTLISGHDQKYYSQGLFSSEYGRRRDVWNQRLHELDSKKGSIERRQSGSVHRLDAAESRRKREQQRKDTRSAERQLGMEKRRGKSGSEGSYRPTSRSISDVSSPVRVRKTSAEREAAYLARTHPSLTRSRSGSPGMLELPPPSRSVTPSDFDDFTQGTMEGGSSPLMDLTGRSIGRSTGGV